jgi:hypothetical protein
MSLAPLAAEDSTGRSPAPSATDAAGGPMLSGPVLLSTVPSGLEPPPAAQEPEE